MTPNLSLNDPAFVGVVGHVSDIGGTLNPETDFLKTDIKLE